MAQPRWTSLDPLVVRDGVLDVGRGNWQPGQDSGSQLDNPKWTYVAYIDGQLARGFWPQMPSVPAATTYPGELPWSQRGTLQLASYADGREHQARVHIFAASFFKGWGDAPEDRWEWGHYSARDESPAVLTAKFTLGAPPPPPPPADPYPWLPHLANARDDLELAVAAYYTKRGQTLEARKVLFRQRFAMMQQLGQCSDEQRVRAHAALARVFGWPR